MPQPQELKSPHSAGPEALKSKIPSKEDFSDLDLESMAKQPPDFSDLNLEAMANPQNNVQPSELGVPSETGITSTAEAEAVGRAGLETAKIFGTEMAGGLATQGAGAMIGGAIGLGLGGGIGAAAGAYAGGVLGSYFTKDVVNPLRKAVGLPSEEDRSRATDMVLSGIFSIPGLIRGIDTGFEAVSKGLAKEAIDPDLAKSVVVEANVRELNRDNAQIIAAMSPEERTIMRSVRDAVVDAQRDLYTGEKVFTPEVAAEKAFEFEKDWLALTKRDGLNAAQAAQVLMNKYGNQIQAHKLVNDLAEMVGTKLTKEDLQTIVSQPGKIIENKTKALVNQWDNAVETLRKVRNIPYIDSREYMQKLQTIRAEASDAGEAEVTKALDNIITTLGDRKKIIDASVFAEQTGGKPPTFIEVGKTAPITGTTETTVEKLPTEVVSPAQGQPGFQFGPSMRGKFTATEDTRRTVPGVSTPTEYIPAVTKQEQKELGQLGFEIPETPVMGQAPLTAEEQAARLLPGEFPVNELVIPPAFAKQTNASILKNVDVLIKQRSRLDSYIKTLPEGEKKQAYIKAVTALRDVEDPFIDSLIGSGNSQFRNAGIEYKRVKGALRDLNDSVDSIGKFGQQDSMAVVRALDSADSRVVKIWSGVQPQKVRSKIAREFVMNKLGMPEGLPLSPITPDEALRVSKLVADPTFASKIESLAGKGAADQIQSTLKQIYKASRVASTLPTGVVAQSPGVKKVLFDALNSLARVKPFDSINRLYAGRYLLDADSRAYRDFIKFSLSSDFDATMNSIQGITEINAAKQEIKRLFPVQDSIAQRALRVLDDRAVKSIPYVGSFMRGKYLYPAGGVAKGAFVGRGKTEGGAGDFQMEKDQPSDFQMEAQ